MAESDALHQHLLDLLRGRNAHADFDTVMADFPSRQRGVKPPGAPHTGWQLLEHMRIAQWDILEFSRNADHRSPDWPTGYWPAKPAPPNAGAWNKTIRSFRDDLDAMCNLVADESRDLFAPIPHGDGQTCLVAAGADFLAVARRVPQVLPALCEALADQMHRLTAQLGVAA